MEQPWVVNVWGVRGSMPNPALTVCGYGGNTSCISVAHRDSMVIFDAGSGLLKLGNQLWDSEISRLDLFISHVHLDHILGLFMFPALFSKRMEIHIYGEARAGIPFSRQLSNVFGPPYWPVKLEECATASVTIHEIKAGDCVTLPVRRWDGASVSTARGNHPNESIMFRLSEPAGRSVVYTLDCELNEDVKNTLQSFARNADLMIWDASYTLEDLQTHRGWGHSCWQEGAELKEAANVGTVLMCHYSPAYTDKILEEQESKARGSVLFAREGMKLNLLRGSACSASMPEDEPIPGIKCYPGLCADEDEDATL